MVSSEFPKRISEKLKMSGLAMKDAISSWSYAQSFNAGPQRLRATAVCPPAGSASAVYSSCGTKPGNKTTTCAMIRPDARAPIPWEVPGDHPPASWHSSFHRTSRKPTPMRCLAYRIGPMHSARNCPPGRSSGC